MRGWKTWLAGAGMAILGAAQIVQGEPQTGIMTILQGFAVVGIGHKIEKINP